MGKTTQSTGIGESPGFEIGGLHAGKVQKKVGNLQREHDCSKKRSKCDRSNNENMIQVDGLVDSSDDEDPDEDEEGGDDDTDSDGEEEGIEDEPLGSEDDIPDEDASELFETDNVMVCQYEKVTRARNKWKFHLKDGIMNLNGRDYVFQRALGEAEW